MVLIIYGLQSFNVPRLTDLPGGGVLQGIPQEAPGGYTRNVKSSHLGNNSSNYFHSKIRFQAKLRT